MLESKEQLRFSQRFHVNFRLGTWLETFTEQDDSGSLNVYRGIPWLGKQMFVMLLFHRDATDTGSFTPPASTTAGDAIKLFELNWAPIIVNWSIP